jgi:hypothetical protein
VTTRNTHHATRKYATQTTHKTSIFLLKTATQFTSIVAFGALLPLAGASLSADGSVCAPLILVWSG